jgi:hypothetical protein
MTAGVALSACKTQTQSGQRANGATRCETGQHALLSAPAEQAVECVGASAAQQVALHDSQRGFIRLHNPDGTR